MRKFFFIAWVLSLSLTACQSKQSSTPAPSAESTPPLVLTGQVPLEGVKGRFDHFATGKGRVFVSGLGNNTVEVIGVFEGTRVHEITGVPGPQGVAFSPEANKLFVASEKGKLYIYDGDSFKLLTTLDFEGGADNLRYDATNKRVYVACGDDEKTSAIATVDAMTNKRLDEVYKLGAEPESFQLEKSGPNIYVNLPELKQIAVIDRTTKEIKRWPITVGQNFPMALDEADHRLFVASREPAALSSLTPTPVAWSPSCPAFRTPTICITALNVNAFSCRVARDSSTSINRVIRTTIRCLPKSPQFWEGARRVTLADKAKDSTASIWPFLPAAALALKSEFILSKIRDQRIASIP